MSKNYGGNIFVCKIKGAQTSIIFCDRVDAITPVFVTKIGCFSGKPNVLKQLLSKKLYSRSFVSQTFYPENNYSISIKFVDMSQL